DVIKTNHRTTARYLDSGFCQSAQSAESSHVVISHQCSELPLTLEQFVCHAVAVIHAQVRIALVGQVDNQPLVQIQTGIFGEALNAAPTRLAAGECFWSSNKSNFPMS